MNLYSRPAHVDLDPSWSITSLLEHRVAKDPDRTLVEVQVDGVWQPMSGAAFTVEVARLARGLIASGVQAGDRIAIMSHTSYEWMLIDFAIWAAGAVSVPIYETSSADQAEWICTDSEVSAVFVELPQHLAVIDEIRPRTPALRQVWQINGGAIDDLDALGESVTEAELAARRDAVVLADLATIIYTSGTTGRPKGVELTHESFVFIAANVGTEMADACARPESRQLVFLPLAHIFARAIEILAIGQGTVIGHCRDTKSLVADLQSFRPTVIVAVPRVFEKLYNSAEQAAGSGVRLKLFRWSAKVAIVHSRARETANGPSLVLSAQHVLADRLVYSKIRATLGGHLTYSFSSGAPLGERLGHFFRGMGISIVEGYGLTESTAPATCNHIDTNRIGTVGPVTAGTSARISESGEIQLKGPNVFRGYHGNPQATADALVDGWFSTGDLGSFDDDGFLRVTGRIKEIIVTAGGKNVAPALLEDRLRGHPLVSQCVVVGDKKPFIAALVTLDAAMLPGWLAAHGCPPLTEAEARQSPTVLAALDRAVTRTNRAVSRAESIRTFAILDLDFTEANGYLTPSLKVKRTQVLADFADRIEEMYAGRPPAATPDDPAAVARPTDGH